MNRTTALDHLRASADAVRSMGATALYLFGSTVRNEAGVRPTFSAWQPPCSTNAMLRPTHPTARYTPAPTRPTTARTMSAVRRRILTTVALRAALNLDATPRKDAPIHGGLS